MSSLLHILKKIIIYQYKVNHTPGGSSLKGTCFTGSMSSVRYSVSLLGCFCRDKATIRNTIFVIASTGGRPHFALVGIKVHFK